MIAGMSQRGIAFMPEAAVMNRRYSTSGLAQMPGPLMLPQAPVQLQPIRAVPASVSLSSTRSFLLLLLLLLSPFIPFAPSSPCLLFSLSRFYRHSVCLMSPDRVYGMFL